MFERWLLWNNNCYIDDKRRNKKYRKTTSWENKMTWLLTKCNKHTVYFFLSTVVAIPFFLCPFYVSQHWQIRLWIPPDLAVRLHQRPTKRRGQMESCARIMYIELYSTITFNYVDKTYLDHQSPDFLLWKFRWQLPKLPSRDVAAVILVQGGECQLRPRHHLSLE